MTAPEPCFSINVDVTNPGQFFACCGVLELAHRLWPGTEGWFEEGRFSVRRSGGHSDSVEELLSAIVKCDVQPVMVADPKTDPIRLDDPVGLKLDWWRRPDGTTNLFKTWAANATAQQMFCKWQKPLQRAVASFNGTLEELLTLNGHVQGSYGFDSDLGWDALSVGFSVNEHTSLKKLPTRPAVELFGAVGLQRFFPNLDERAQVVRYATWSVPLCVPVARIAALGCVPSVLKHGLRTRFVYRGSFKGLDRAIFMKGDTNE